MNWINRNKTKPLKPQDLPEKALYLCDFLAEDRILFVKESTSKEMVLSKLVDILPYPKKELAEKAVFDREKIGSTVLENGIAVPHARLVDIPDIMASLAVCPSGVSEPASNKTIRIFLLFLGPTNYMKRNLDFLASASSLFQTEEVINTILQSPDARTVLKVIRDSERQ